MKRLLLLVAISVFVPAFTTLAQPIQQLMAGQDVVMERDDRSGLVLVPGDDPIVRFLEVGGAPAVVRVTPMDRAGRDLGSGRVIVIGASETRHLRLRGELAADALRGTQLRVEFLEGPGRVVVTCTEEMGRGLRPQANSTPPRRRAVLAPKKAEKPTSLSLINTAEKAGALNSETALLYRVYALFSDARLPAAYRGDDRRIIDSRYLSIVRERYPSLSLATQAAVQPFLIPPRFRGSWTDPDGLSNSVVDPLPDPKPCDFANSLWTFVDASFSTPVRIWYRVDSPDALIANNLAATIDTIIWPRIFGLMRTVPVSDTRERCNGNSGRLDVYLIDIARSFEVTYQVCTGRGQPGYVMLNRLSSRSIAAHEIFHAFEDSYPVCTTADIYAWWAEASATWIEDYVFPTDQAEQESASYLLDVPEQPLDLSDDSHEYGAYLLPFYLDRVTGNADVVRVAWEKCATLPAVDALDKALAGGFEAVWPEFAKYNWNQKPVDNYKTLDGLTDTPKPAGGALNVSAAPESVFDLDLGLPPLSATYKHFVFDDNVRTIAFWNGVTTKLVLRDSPPLGVSYVSEPATAEQKKGAHVTALIRKGEKWTTDNWTDQPLVTFCRDLTAERIDELVLIISNSDFEAGQRKLEAPGLKPVLFASNVGCWQWKGTATLTEVEGDTTTTISTNVTWTRDDSLQPRPQALVLYKAEGTESWKQSGFCSGSGTLPILPEFSYMYTSNLVPSQGTTHRTYYGYGIDSRDVDVICKCDPPCPGTFTLSPWFANAPTIPPLLRVDANGNIDGSFDQFESAWKWHMEPQRQ